MFSSFPSPLHCVKGNKSFHLTFHFHPRLNPPLLSTKPSWISWIPNSYNKWGFLSSLPRFFLCPLWPSCPHGLLSFCHLALVGTKISKGHMDQLEDFRSISWKICQEFCNKAFKKSILSFSKSQQLAGDRRYFRIWHGWDFEEREKKNLKKPSAWAAISEPVRGCCWR